MDDKIKSVQKLADIIDTMLDGYALGDTPEGASIASAIADSGFLFSLEQEARAQGWDEGVQTGYDYGRQEEKYSLAYAVPTNNPYKERARREEENK